jgi:hypothetical protein
MTGGDGGWAVSVTELLPSVEVAAAVWAADGSAVVELAGVSACCSRGSPVGGWLGVGLSGIEAVTGSFGNVADEATLG